MEATGWGPCPLSKLPPSPTHTVLEKKPGQDAMLHIASAEIGSSVFRPAWSRAQTVSARRGSSVRCPSQWALLLSPLALGVRGFAAWGANLVFPVPSPGDKEDFSAAPVPFWDLRVGELGLGDFAN